MASRKRQAPWVKSELNKKRFVFRNYSSIQNPEDRSHPEFNRDTQDNRMNAPLTAADPVRPVYHCKPAGNFKIL